MNEPGLIVEAELPFVWVNRLPTSIQRQEGRLLLRVVNLLGFHDFEQDKASARLEAKLDLMLYWLGYRLFGENEDMRPTRLRLGHDSIEWQADSREELAETGMVKLGIHPAVPGPLLLAGQTIECAGQMRTQLLFPDQESEDAWSQWLFNQHRRAIQEERGRLHDE